MNESWVETDDWPALSSAEVHLWLAHFPTARARLAEFVALLSSDERERAALFRFDEHRGHSQITRGILRSLLAHYTGRDAGTLSFAYSAHGKPELKSGDVRFNASHSGEYAVFAFTHAGAVGVDIERIHGDMLRHEAIASRHFAPGEQRHLSSLLEGERVRAFFQLWTHKEAFVKARGDGLFSGLDQFEISIEGPRIVSINGLSATDWWISSLPEVAGYAGAVVVNAPACTPKFWKWK